MKKFVRAVCLLMALVMLMVTPAFAAEIPQTRASDFFAMTSTYLDQVSSTKMEIWFDVCGVGTMQEIGVKTIKMQRSSDQTNWTTVQTYSRDDYSQMIDTNTTAHADCVTYTGSSGYYYRAYVTFYAKDSSGTGQNSYYTATKYMHPNP